MLTGIMKSYGITRNKAKSFEGIHGIPKTYVYDITDKSEQGLKNVLCAIEDQLNKKGRFLVFNGNNISKDAMNDQLRLALLPEIESSRYIVRTDSDNKLSLVKNSEGAATKSPALTERLQLEEDLFGIGQQIISRFTDLMIDQQNQEWELLKYEAACDKNVIEILAEMSLKTTEKAYKSESRKREMLSEFSILVEKAKTEELGTYLDDMIRKARDEKDQNISEVFQICRSKIEIEQIKHDTKRIAENTKVEIELIHANQRILKQELENNIKHQTRQDIVAHNKKLIEALPEMHNQFIKKYEEFLKQRNEKVKNIKDHIKLPYIKYDSEGLAHIVEGEILNG